jgi:hypothetical protein
MDKIRLLYHQAQRSAILNNKILNVILKSIIVVGVGYSLYHKIASEDDLPQMLANIKTYLVFPNLYLLLLTFLLMPLMFWVESYRWLSLVKNMVPESSANMNKSVKAMLSGQTLGMFIPYRIGKIGGRILVYATNKKWELVVINLFDGEGMKILFDLAGLGGVVYVLYHYFDIDYHTSLSLGLIGLVLLGVRFYFFFNIRRLNLWLSRFKGLERVIRKLEVLEQYSKKELIRILEVGVIRMLLNFLQYYLLLRFFHIEVDFGLALVLISAIYFFVANMPLPAIAGLFARIHIAILIWSDFSDNIISISSIPFLIWIFNSLIPAIAGSIFVMKLNIVKHIKHNDD